MTTVTVFLTTDRGLMFREVRNDLDAIRRIRTAKVVAFEMPVSPGPAAFEQVFAVTNSVAVSTDQRNAEIAYRADGETRSLSVGDLVHVEGEGIASVSAFGFARHDHRMVATAAARRAVAAQV